MEVSELPNGERKIKVMKMLTEEKREMPEESEFQQTDRMYRNVPKNKLQNWRKQ